ncbi:MAG: DUF3604 domain-containing protein, partial [Proteobacteria bacterium]|nr:DUF3604 domain-containing protein [Pseudomonadota bacterium]
RQRAAAVAVSVALSVEQGVTEPKQILFGDLHVHTTVSFDAFMLSLPLLQGEGAHPQADACDFARFCSGLDFWSINDHAEGFTPIEWRETVQSIRECNTVAGDAANPDVVAFLGWEWTQVGTTPEDHYGHKNVILRHTDDERIPARPIAAIGRASQAFRSFPGPFQLGLLAVAGGDARYNDFARFAQERTAFGECRTGVPVRELRDCVEYTRTPAELFEKLDDWGHEAIVIPHGTTWGFYTPPGNTWDKQLESHHDPDRQTLIEIYSGHGNSEEYRDWRGVDSAADGSARCPEPEDDYLPSCWRAGEIIRARCSAAGLGADECETRAAEARQLAAEAGAAGHLTVPGVEMEEWLDSGQCRDCFQPAFNYRPGGSAQYIMAIRNFDDPANPKRFRMGFMASSDNHTARPGTGFKELNRREMTEATGPAEDQQVPLLTRPDQEPAPRSVPFDPETTTLVAFQLTEGERQASFFLTGGLVAVHSEGRDRDAIWQAMDRREVYGTSGPRILLWFDLVRGEQRLPMGSEVTTTANPTFEVRAVGSFEQKPGCPDYSTGALTAERLEHVCRSECYHPSDTRRPITRIEVIRIRPQVEPGEDVAELIDDPWKIFDCPGDPAGCSVRFEDPDFAEAGRDTLYYARAVEAPAPAINAANLRCESDDEGTCVEVHPCFGDFRTDYEDDCLSETEQRAWSSPIFVDYAP